MLLTSDIMSRRNHRERAQPLHRQKLGLLEKHKDYVHRARDYKSKKDRIKKLREKAAFRNKDEFYYGMVKGKTKGGVAVQDRGNEALSVDVVKLLKTQDLGYVKMQIAQDEKVGSAVVVVVLMFRKLPGCAPSSRSQRRPRGQVPRSGVRRRSSPRSRSWPRWALCLIPVQ